MFTSRWAGRQSQVERYVAKNRPTIEELSQDIYRIEIPLPLPVLDSVNAYVAKGSGRNHVLDPGMYRNQCEDAMRAALDRLNVGLEETDFFRGICPPQIPSGKGLSLYTPARTADRILPLHLQQKRDPGEDGCGSGGQ